mmetsp:Transcript_12328/g.37594  ORF Transcript_12328/g.37594 Transcript_12328/m.37594 type:complete len:209 (+) Transcript_12328:1107-1733(+)
MSHAALTCSTAVLEAAQVCFLLLVALLGLLFGSEELFKLLQLLQRRLDLLKSLLRPLEGDATVRFASLLRCLVHFLHPVQFCPLEELLERLAHPWSPRVVFCSKPVLQGGPPALPLTALLPGVFVIAVLLATVAVVLVLVLVLVLVCILLRFLVCRCVRLGSVPVLLLLAERLHVCKLVELVQVQRPEVIKRDLLIPFLVHAPVHDQP